MAKRNVILKKKGLSMTQDMINNPDKYRDRVCVAYDKDEVATPCLYVLMGSHDHTNEHVIRRAYAKTVGIDYFNTRVILYSTFKKRMKTNQKFKVATV